MYFLGSAKRHEMLFANCLGPKCECFCQPCATITYISEIGFPIIHVFHVYENLNFILGKNVNHIGYLKLSKMYTI